MSPLDDLLLVILGGLAILLTISGLLTAIVGIPLTCIVVSEKTKGLKEKIKGRFFPNEG